MKRIKLTRWQLDLSQWWVLKPFIRPENKPVGLNDGEMDVFEFFHLKNTHTEKPDAFLFIEAYSRYDKLTAEKYCVKLMNELTYAYFYPMGYAYEVWQSLKKEVEYHDDGYAILNIDKYVIYDSEEVNERTKLLRVATKALIFKDMVIKVTFKHDSACDLHYSKSLSDPIFESFIAIPKVEK